MCTRYALEKDLPELKDIFEIAKRSPLTSKFIDTHARPLITDGEVRPTDIVPVIAPNAKGLKSVFPMQWGFLARDGNVVSLMPELNLLWKSPPSRMPVMLPKERIDAWISPASNPEEILPYALSDMVVEKAEG